MSATCNGLRKLGIGLGMQIAISLASPPVAAHAESMFQIDWRVTGTVRYWSEGPERASTTRHQLNGSGTLTLARDPSPDVRFAFDFVGPDGRGSGLVPRAAEQAVDPNFAFPNPLPPGLPPAEGRALRGRFLRSGAGPVPPAFQIIYSETFVCRSTPEACGNVKQWDILFIGSARSAAPSPGRP